MDSHNSTAARNSTLRSSSSLRKSGMQLLEMLSQSAEQVNSLKTELIALKSCRVSPGRGRVGGRGDA